MIWLDCDIMIYKGDYIYGEKKFNDYIMLYYGFVDDRM